MLSGDRTIGKRSHRRLATQAEQHFLEVSDNGVGYLPTWMRKPSSLGFRLVSMLTRQLKARWMSIASGKGTKFKITFPLEAKERLNRIFIKHRK